MVKPLVDVLLAIGAVNGVTLGKETLNNWLVQIKSTTSFSLIPDMAVAELEGKTVVLLSIDGVSE